MYQRDPLCQRILGELAHRDVLSRAVDDGTGADRIRTALRYTGLVGTILLAYASVVAKNAGLAEPAWLAGTGLLLIAWLVLGRRLADVPARWLFVTATLWALPMLASAPLASRDIYSYACQGTLVSHGIDPYSHGVADLPCPWLSTVPKVWQHTPSPYGPLWLVLTGGAAATGRLALAIAVLRIFALAGMVLVAWAGHRLAGKLGTDPVRGAWLGVLAPVVLVHALSGAHNDALLAGLVVTAFALAAGAIGPISDGARVLAWRAVAAGVLIGLAVAVKITALVALPFVVLLLAADRRWGPIIRAGVLTCLGLIATYAALWATTGYGFGWVRALPNTTRSIVEWTSIPTGAGMGLAHALRRLGQAELAHHTVSYARAAGLGALALIVLGLWLWARGRATPRAVVLAGGLALLVTVLLSPVAFPWYALAALAVLGYGIVEDRWRYGLGLLTAPVMLLILPNGNGLASFTRTSGALFDLLVILAAVLVAAYRTRRWLSRKSRTRAQSA